MPLQPPEGDWPPPPGPEAERLAPGRVLRRLGVVPEDAMREALWREVLTALPPTDVLPILAEIRRALAAGELAGRLGWLALVRTLEALRGGPIALKLYLHAKLAGDEATTSLLLEPPPARKAEAHALQRPPLDRDREITLGERRAWARKHDRAVLARLLYDPDPGVVLNLLNNPRITEADVLRVASRRPTVAPVLQTVFRHARWGRRRPVQLALVLNPYTPVDTACGLVALLDRESARKVRQDLAVHPTVRTTAAIMLGEYLTRPLPARDAIEVPAEAVGEPPAEG
ncbi:MAG: hypothetical protein KC613_15900 [Myxococcales bacterium]|nr:hypothetical protein [Myxococcales bacterium]